MEKYVTRHNCDNCGATITLEIPIGMLKEEWINRNIDRKCNNCQCNMFDKEMWRDE